MIQKTPAVCTRLHFSVILQSQIMANWKERLTMSRHERVGVLAVMAFIAFTLFALWLTSRCAPADTSVDQREVEQFAASIDSLRTSRQAGDSARSAHGHNRGHDKHPRDAKPPRHGAGKQRGPSRTAPAHDRTRDTVRRF